jgi:hypothetical protein
MKRAIWFDMDGTIADLYSVDNWLPKLRASDPSPYAEAKPMLNFSLLARYLNKLQAKGYHIGIISWASLGCDADYYLNIYSTKTEWLEKHLPSVKWDNIWVTKYGIQKSVWMKQDDDILFDDNVEVRNEWIGDAYEPNNILKVLKELLKGE